MYYNLVKKNGEEGKGMEKDYLKEETEKAFSRTAKEIENALKKTPITAEQMDAWF